MCRSLQWPVDAAPALTSTFCGYRPGHFHSGIDIKTFGQVGLPCRAVDDGQVVRVKVSPGGYGKALYLQLQDGRIVVYAHLSGFSEAVQAIVRKEQMRNRQFDLDYYFEDDEVISFKEGEVVAFSGRSGVRHPHVHFEIRENWNTIINPLLTDYDMPDHYAPTPTGVAITPLNIRSTVERDVQPRIYNRLMLQRDGVYRIGEPVGVSGRVGVSIEAFDRANGAENLLAAYRIELQVNGEARWTSQFDRFTFDETRQIELERDYRLMRNHHGVYRRLYRTPGLDLEQMTSGDGIIEMTGVERERIDVRIILSDISGNAAEVELILISDKLDDPARVVTGEPLFGGNRKAVRGLSIDIMGDFLRLSAPHGVGGFHLDGRQDYVCLSERVEGGVFAAWKPPDDFTDAIEITALDRESGELDAESLILHRVYRDRDNLIQSEDEKCRVSIPAGALYSDGMLRIIAEPHLEVADWIEPVYRIEPLDRPISQRIKISLKGGGLGDGTGWGLYYLDEKRGWTFLGNDHEFGYYSGEALSREVFGLVRDGDVPYLKVLKPKDGQVLSDRRPMFMTVVRDSTSGVVAEDLTMNLDGDTLPAEFDPPFDRFFFQPWQDLSSGNHTLVIIVTDRVGNTTVDSVGFTIE